MGIEGKVITETIKKGDENNKIYVCFGCEWEGRNEERSKKRDEEKNGFWRICPECNGEDFYIKSQLYRCLTYSIPDDVAKIIIEHTDDYGLPQKNH